MKIRNIAFGLASIAFTIAALPAQAAVALNMGGASCSFAEAKYYNPSIYKWTKDAAGMLYNYSNSDVTVICPVIFNSELFPTLTVTARIHDNHSSKNISCTRWFGNDRFETRTSSGISNYWADLTFSPGVVNTTYAALSCVIPSYDTTRGGNGMSGIQSYNVKQ